MKGKIYVIGTGPGYEKYICPYAMEAMKSSDVIIGYKTYVELIRPILPDKNLISSKMMKEVERCMEVLHLAEEGKVVSLISSGDPGIYGMAGIMLEVVDQKSADVEVEIVPGISAASSAASLLGAPLMNDFAVLSMSDLLTPWEVITKRVEAASQGDFVMAIYNPKSKTRVTQLQEAVAIISKYRDLSTPAGIVKHAMRDNQEVIVTTLGDLLEHNIDMFTTVVIGNSQTQVIGGKMVTRRGYKL